MKTLRLIILSKNAWWVFSAQGRQQAGKERLFPIWKKIEAKSFKNRQKWIKRFKDTFLNWNIKTNFSNKSSQKQACLLRIKKTFWKFLFGKLSIKEKFSEWQVTLTGNTSCTIWSWTLFRLTWQSRLRGKYLAVAFFNLSKVFLDLTIFSTWLRSNIST